MHVSNLNGELAVPHRIRSKCLAGLKSFRPKDFTQVLHGHIDLVVSCFLGIEENWEVLIGE